MGAADEHPQLVHSLDGAPAEDREAAVARLAQPRAQGVRAAVGDPQGAYAKAVEAGDDELSPFFSTALPLVGTAGDTAGYAVGTATSVVANVEDLALSERLVAQLYAAQPDDPRVSYAGARIWALQGQELDKAEPLLLAYVELPELPRFAPSHAGAHWRLGTVYEKQERKSDALARYRAAAEMEPDFRQAHEDAERLAKELGGK